MPYGLLINNIQHKNTSEFLHTHSHQSYELIYVTAGLIEITINQRKYIVGKNQIIFLSRLEEHSIKILKTPYERYFITVDPELLNVHIQNVVLLSIFKNRPSHYQYHLDISPISHLINSLFEQLLLEFNETPLMYEDKLIALFQQLLIEVYRLHKNQFSNSIDKAHHVIYRIQTFIENNFQQNLKIGDIASDFFISPCYLSHKFKDVTGFSPKQYLTLNRLSHARSLLLSTDFSTEQVAIKSGFPDVNNFIRLFKSFYDKTPYQYKKAY